MKDRLAEFLKTEGLTAVKFAEIMEVQPSSISHLLAGRNKPNFEFISRMLLRFPELNPDWIINGKGVIYKSKSQSNNADYTTVNEAEITAVTNTDRKSSAVGVKDVNTHNNTDNQQSDLFQNSPVECVTDVNSRLVDIPVDSMKVCPSNSEKEISRVILFFSDGSFEEYRK